MQVYGLVGQTSEGIWPSAALRVIYLPQSDQPVRKLAYCPQAHVLFVKYYYLSPHTLKFINLPTFIGSTFVCFSDNCISRASSTERFLLAK